MGGLGVGPMIGRGLGVGRGRMINFLECIRQRKKEMGAGVIVGIIFGVIAAAFLVWFARNSGWFSKEYKLTGPDEMNAARRDSAALRAARRRISDEENSKFERTLAFIEQNLQHKNLTADEKRRLAWDSTRPDVSGVPKIFTTTAQQYRIRKKEVVSAVEDWEGENANTWKETVARLVAGPPASVGTYR